MLMNGKNTHIGTNISADNTQQIANSNVRTLFTNEYFDRF